MSTAHRARSRDRSVPLVLAMIPMEATESRDAGSELKPPVDGLPSSPCRVLAEWVVVFDWAESVRVEPAMLLLLPDAAVDVALAPVRDAPAGGCVLKLVSHVPADV